MVQVEKGLFSGCKCPECFNVCRDCMGMPAGPKTPEELKSGFVPTEGGDADDSYPDCDNDDDAPRGDWRKYL